MFSVKFKKVMASVLAVMMVFSMTSIILPSFAAQAEYPVMEAYNSGSSGDYHKYYNKVYSVTFLDKIDYDSISSSDTIGSWDVSANDDASVMAWMKLNSEETAAAGADRYDVYIAGEGGVAANPDSSWIFYLFTSLEKINNPENFKTGNATTFFSMFLNCSSLKNIDLSAWDVSNVTNMKNMFVSCVSLESIDLSSWDVSSVTTLNNMFAKCYGLTSVNLSGWNTQCVTDMSGIFDMTDNTNKYDSALRSIDLTGWNTSNITTMENMFKNCQVLEELDLSSFDTSKVTNMRFMFYYCKALKNIYVGDGWTTEAILNVNDGVFNCCYAVIGGTDNEEENIKIYNELHPQLAPGVEYAKLKEEGGYLTHISEKPQPEIKEYKVTYEFTGSLIPEGVTAPAEVIYEEGSTANVEAVPCVDGYIFSGWTTSDAVVADNSFTVNNDVHFTGSWIKTYKVIYKYTEGYDVPQAAPELPETVAYKAGDAVNVDSPLPFVDGYVFVGWTTTDVNETDGRFTMPEKDVTFYGYFKKPVDSVEINGGDVILNKDEEIVINVTVKPEDATVKDIIFESSDEDVVKVDENGNITAVGEGTAIITVFSKDDTTKKDSIKVTVKIPVTDITVDKESITLYKNETDKITADVIPENATNKNITYTSSDESVIKVDENGNITAVGEGTAKITVASQDNPSAKKEILITVKKPVTEVTATEDFTLNVGEEKNVDAKVNEDATDKELIYSSSDPGIVKVDNLGNVFAVGEGTATITVTSKDNPEVKTEVTVTVKVPVEEIAPEKDEIILDVGESEKIEITVTPENATNKELEYTSSDESVVKVDKDGNITAIGEGTAVITVTSKDNPEEKTEVTVTVKVPVEIIIPVTSITASDDFTLEIGQSKNADASVNEDATNKQLIYSSSDESVAIVDKNGNITAVGEGSAVITIVSAENPEIKETVAVTVTKPEYVINAPDSITIFELEIKNIDAVVSPAEGAPAITYTSADESIVKVDADGNITGIAPGTTTITLDIGNGNIKVITIIVMPASASLPIPTKYHIAFGKTDGIGWYEVSVNGGDFFPQGPNSTLEVDKGSVIVVRVQDMWIDDDFTFYVNGSKVEKDAANCITLTVDGYMLIGALSMDYDVPDVEESLTLLEKIINAIKAFFDMIASWFN